MSSFHKPERRDPTPFGRSHAKLRGMLRSSRALGLVALVCLGCSGAAEDEGELADYDAFLKSACPPATVVEGIDIASYQHPNGASINWPTVAQGEHFVIVKASESTGYVNSYYADDVSKARQNGIVAGAYHYLRYGTSGSAQAAHFLSAIGGSVADGDLPPMLDVEDTKDSATAAQRVQIMKDWLDTVEQATGRKPMIYSGAWYWGPYLGTPAGFSDHPLVWAAYTGSTCPKIPDDFPGLAIWQYLGGQGSTAGINAACDQDKFYGSQADLLALANAKIDFAGAPIGKDGQSYPIVADGAVTVEVGQTVTGWVKLENVGSQTWKPGVVWLAPIPRDQASPYASKSWLASHRISSVKADVPPGQIGEFSLDITGSTPGEAILSLGWVAEGITWFADAPKGGGPTDGYFAVKVNVVPSTAPDAGTGGASGAAGAAGSGSGWSGGAGNVDAGSGAKGGGAGQSQNTRVKGDDSGCGCRAPGGDESPRSAWLAALALALALGVRSRRGG